MSLTHEIRYDITFGDCDPAGIVFYPNAYAWMDRCFHDFLRRFGGHAALCRRLGALGLGLRGAEAQFRRPMRDGDALRVVMVVEEISSVTLTLRYEGHVGDTLCFTGTERRAMFVKTETGITAGDLAPLAEILRG